MDHGLTLAIFGMPGGSEWIILLVLGLLVFGRRLPEVGRSLGRSIVEFKRGIKGVEDEIESEASRSGGQIADQSARSELPSSAGVGVGAAGTGATVERKSGDG